MSTYLVAWVVAPNDYDYVERRTDSGLPVTVKYQIIIYLIKNKLNIIRLEFMVENQQLEIICLIMLMK